MLKMAECRAQASLEAIIVLAASVSALFIVLQPSIAAKNAAVALMNKREAESIAHAMAGLALEARALGPGSTLTTTIEPRNPMEISLAAGKIIATSGGTKSEAAAPKTKLLWEGRARTQLLLEEGTIYTAEISSTGDVVEVDVKPFGKARGAS